jgi:hypothetical protein
MAVEIADAVAGVAAVVVAVVDAGAVVVPVVVEGAADGTAGMAAVVGTKIFRHGFARIFTDKAATLCGGLFFLLKNSFNHRGH